MDLDKLATALEVFGTLSPGAMPVHHFQLILEIEKGGKAGLTYAQLEERFQLSNAAISRSVNALSANARHRKSSFDLVEIFRDLDEGRRYRIRLTSKGMALVRSMKQL